MNPHKTIGIAGTLLLFAFSTAAQATNYVLENDFIRREISITNDHLRTVCIVNKITTNGIISPDALSPEFRLRLSEGTDQTDLDILLDASNFQVVGAEQTQEGDTAMLRVQAENTNHNLHVEIRYSLGAQDAVMRKSLVITSNRTTPQWVLEHIDLEILGIGDAVQPYTKDAITAYYNVNSQGNWSPNLGQPLYTSSSATFWGVEFPAARNEVMTNGQLRVGYSRGMPLEAGVAYTTHSAVVGVADDPEYVTDAFQDYISSIRIRPLRIQTQYNSWFDYGSSVDRENFSNSVAKIHQELVVTRGVRPLSRYVIDDGWQDVAADWSDKVWKVNGKFDADFAATRGVLPAGSELGLWLSPGCLFGAQGQVPKLRDLGFEALDNWMSMAGPAYMQALEDRMVELAGEGVGFFKLDGIFGHLYQRNFELHGASYGLPEMPQLGLEGLNSGSAALNDPHYDELKLYYLTAGTERLIQLFSAVSAVDPDTYIVISNGAYLSPWWLMHIDAVWMINAGDAAGGSSRTEELVYRDGIYHQIFMQENTQFPLHSLFNHEPKKTSSGESAKSFRDYLYMSLSRGTGFVESYIKSANLSASDWSVLAEGHIWVEDMLPAFAHARMHGGDPEADEVYGYTGWSAEGGYLSIHNPSNGSYSYTITLDRTLGLVPGEGNYYLSSPIPDNLFGLPVTAKYGDTLTIDLAAREIRLLHFDRTPRDWSEIRALQENVESLNFGKVIKPVGVTSTIAGDAGSSHLYLLDDNPGNPNAGLQHAEAPATLETGTFLSEAMQTYAYRAEDGHEESWTSPTGNGNPVFVFDLTGGDDTPLDSAILWQYGNNGGPGTDNSYNSTKNFEIIWHTEAQGNTFDFESETINFNSVMAQITGDNTTDNIAQVFPLGARVNVRYVALRIVSNYDGIRFGLGEVRFSAEDFSYPTWVATVLPGQTNPSIVAFDADPDYDGIPNGIEMWFGTSPVSPSPGLTLTGVSSAGDLSFTHPRSNYPLTGITTGYQWSTDLTNSWYASDETNSLGVTVNISSTVTDDQVAPAVDTLSVQAAIQNGSPPISKLFLRASASPDP